MKLSEIKKLVNKQISTLLFFNNNKEELSSFIDNINNELSSLNIYIEEDDDLVIEDVVKLLELYLSNEIYEWDLEYIFRVIEMSENEDETISKIAFSLSDPYLGLEINVENIELILESIKNKKEISKRTTQEKIKLRESYRTMTFLYDNRNKINDVLAVWNPLSVPKNLAMEEYTSYIPVILSSAKSEKKLLDCLESILVNDLETGYDRNKKEHSDDLMEVVNKIYSIIHQKK